MRDVIALFGAGFLSLLLIWYKALACIAAAVLIRRRRLSRFVAIAAAIVLDIANAGFDIFFAELAAPHLFMLAGYALSALTGIVWWFVGRSALKAGRALHTADIWAAQWLPAGRVAGDHSHSIVPGGFDVTS